MILREYIRDIILEKCGDLSLNAIEKRIRDLHDYKPDRTAEPDLNEYWTKTMEEVNSPSFASERRKRETLLGSAEAYDVTFAGFAGTPVHGVFVKPAADGPVPCLVMYPGYTGGKGDPEQYAKWTSMGIAVFAVDARGQGGTTGNTLGSAHGMTRGWVTEGILDRDRCYYKALAVDNLRAVRWVFEQSDIDASRIGVWGSSQGGGSALLAAAFQEKLRLVVADIPNLCHMDFGVLNSTGSLTEIADFCRRFAEHTAAVLRNISYFDLLNLADRIQMPVLMSVGLKDTICMPETIFPVYHGLSSEDKSLEIYPFTGHAVEVEQTRKAQRFVRKHFFGESI